MSELAADGIAVTVACRVLKLARAPYYRWLATPVTDAEWVQAHRANALFDAHREDPEFGYRFLLDEARDAGQVMVDRTAWRICSDNGWWSAFGKKRGHNAKKPGPPVHDDLCTVTDAKGRVRHRFSADAANELWIGDITEHWTAEGKIYVCAFKAPGPPRPLAETPHRIPHRAGGARRGIPVADRGDRHHHPDRETAVRTHAGLAAARARGRTGGRPRKVDDKKAALIRQLYDSREHSVDTIARMVGLSRTTIYRTLESSRSSSSGAKTPDSS